MKLMKLAVALFVFSCGTVFAAPSHWGLQAGTDGIVLKDGRPYRGIGVNYFTCFLRTLQDADDTSYDTGFRELAERHIPFARFCATAFWPDDLALYRDDREEYFRRLDGVVKSAEKHGVGLVASLFWSSSCVPDLVGEPLSQWGNPQSKTIAFMNEYVNEVVTRYRDSPAIWAWEFSREFGRAAALPNAMEFRPEIKPEVGTAEIRSERDDLTFDMMSVALAEFGRAVRKIDGRRLIFTGDNLPKPSAWHNEHEGKWTRDTKEQFLEMLAKVSPDPINGIGACGREEDVPRYPWALEGSRKMNKPIFISEFTANGGSPEEVAKFKTLLQIIEASSIPLAALWVFDAAPLNESIEVAPDNARAYQLKEVSEANARMAKSAAATWAATRKPPIYFKSTSHDIQK